MMIFSEPGFIGLRSCYFSLAFVQESVILVFLFIPKTLLLFMYLSTWIISSLEVTTLTFNISLNN